MNQNYLSTRVVVVVCLLVLSCVGCASTPAKGTFAKKMPWNKNKPPKPYPNPVRMAATWTPDTLVQTGRTPTRGFGGRLFFYDEKTRAVPVEGDLTVHAFAEGPNGEQGEIKRYHFTSDQFTKHFSQSDLGASYSVWIPWDAVGGEYTRISLVPSFRAKAGRLVQGDQALVGLPGKRKAEESVVVKPNAANELASQRAEAKSGLVTTTIPTRSTLPQLNRQRPAAEPASGLIAQSKPSNYVAQSFDVAPIALQPEATPRLHTFAQPTFARPQFSRPEFSRPARLGQSSVVPASANLPLDESPVR